MNDPGLRQRKKQRMYETLSEIAVRLFLEKGFDAVSVAEIAAAAEISKPTLFRYFPAKEDLVLHRIADHEDEAARVVTESEEAPLVALRRHFLQGLERDDPVTGLNDHPQVLAFHSLLYGTPALVARAHGHLERQEAALAEVLGGISTRGWLPGRSSPCGGFSPWRTGGGSRRGSVWRSCGGTPWPRPSGPSGCWRTGCRGSAEIRSSKRFNPVSFSRVRSSP